MSDTNFIVTEKAQRPADVNGRCFYCNQPIGGFHNHDCVLIIKKVKVKAIIEYEIKVPAHWERDHIEFHRNEGSWCATNMIGELEKLDDESNCLCSHVKFECMDDRGLSFLDEE